MCSKRKYLISDELKQFVKTPRSPNIKIILRRKNLLSQINLQNDFNTFCKTKTGCVNNSYGAKCLKRCSSQCGGANKACNSINGSCIDGCVDGFEGELCDKGNNRILFFMIYIRNYHCWLISYIGLPIIIIMSVMAKRRAKNDCYRWYNFMCLKKKRFFSILIRPKNIEAHFFC